MPVEELPPIGMDVKEIFSNEPPSHFTLFQNYPNPFNPYTQIRYSLPLRARASLKVFDVLGQLVATLVDEEQMPGHYIAVLEGADLSTGLYFYRLEAGSFVETKKALHIK